MCLANTIIWLIISEFFPEIEMVAYIVYRKPTLVCRRRVTIQVSTGKTESAQVSTYA